MKALLKMSTLAEKSYSSYILPQYAQKVHSQQGSLGDLKLEDI